MVASFGRLAERLGRTMSPSREIEGLTVIATVPPSAETEEAFQKVQLALAAIRTAQPRRLVQISRYLRSIWVKRHPASRALYHGGQKICILDTDFVLAADTVPVQVAAAIIHEATHGRIDRWHIPYDEARRPRIERLCRAEELDFGLHHPEGAVVVTRARELLSLPDAEIARSDEAWKEARRQAARIQVNELPLPAFMKRWLIAEADKRVV